MTFSVVFGHFHGIRPVDRGLGPDGASLAGPGWPGSGRGPGHVGQRPGRRPRRGTRWRARAARSLQPNADQQPAPTGTGQISGSVVRADTGKPVRRARVLIASPARRPGKSLTTDDQGHFTFAELPAGRYTVSASKPGYVDAVFGQKECSGRARPSSSRTASTSTRSTSAAPTEGGGRQRVGRGRRSVAGYGCVRCVFRCKPASANWSGRATTRRTTADGNCIYGLPPGDYIVNAAPRINRGDLRGMIQQAVQVVGRGGGIGRVRPGRGGRGGGGAFPNCSTTCSIRRATTSRSVTRPSTTRARRCRRRPPR